jgi:superfamily II DNA or RNA helicase
VTAVQASLFGPAPMLRDARGAAKKRTPRPYQRATIDTAIAQYRQGLRSTLAVMATGTGKTFTASQVMARTLDKGGACLWLNERDNLVTQMCDELPGMLGVDVYREQGPVRALPSARVVVATVQSMTEARLKTFDPAKFSLIVCDEAHHSVTESYRRIIAYFERARILGLSATPQRLDGKAMQLVYEATCADYMMGPAIADGWLAGVRVVPGHQRLDLSKLKKSGDDYTDEAIAGLLTPEVLHGMCKDIHDLHEGRRGVSYWPRVEIAHVAAKTLNTMRPGSARAVDGGMTRDEQNQIFRAHKAGQFLHLCNCGVVVEGYDDEGIAYVYQGRPTRSISRHIQEMGRAGRPPKDANVDAYATAEERRAAIRASSKPDALILDAVGNLGKHAVADPIDALAGKLDDEPTKKRAREILERDGGGDVEAALDAARRLSERDREAEAQRVIRVQAAQFAWGKAVDPFSAFGLAPQTDVANPLAPPPSMRMKRYLFEKMGTVPPTLTDADAQRLSKTIRAREKAGLADLKTVQWLSRHGIAGQRMYQATADLVRQAVRDKRDWSAVEAIIGGTKREPGEDLY